MALQEFEWHDVDDVDFDDAEADILEIVHESGTPFLDGIEPVWTSDWLLFENIIFFVLLYLVEKHVKKKKKEKERKRFFYFYSYPF